MDSDVQENMTYHDLIGEYDDGAQGLDLVMASPELKRLHLSYAEATTMNFLNAGYSKEEIAKILGVSKATVYRTIKRINENHALRKGFLIMD